MRWKRYLLVTLFLTGVFILVQMPARWLVSLVATSEPVSMQEVSGSVWQGHADQVSVLLEGEQWALGVVEWKLQPLWLMGLRVCASLNTTLATSVQSQQVKGDVCWFPGQRWQVKGLEVTAPASLLGVFLPTLAEGQLSVWIESAELDDQRLTELQANSSWRDARILTLQDNRRQWLTLGSFAAVWRAEPDGVLVGDLQELSGPMATQVTIRWPYGRDPQLSGEVRLHKPDPALQQILTWVGFSEQNGRYLLGEVTPGENLHGGAQ